MIGTIVAAALWALAASLLLSVVLGGLVAAAIVLTRPSAATRGALWSVALAAAGFAPVAILAVMLVRGAFAGATDMTAPGSAKATALRTAIRQWADTPITTLPGPAVVVRIPGPPNVAPLAAAGIVAIWALGALIGLAGLGRSLGRVRGLKVRSSPLDGTLATELPWLTTTPGREIYLRLTYETETPIAVGFRRPVILLPTEMATADGLTSIEPLIMHEYAHLARYDDWTNLAQRITERLFWFNPLVWMIGYRIALEREVAADEAVVARTHDPKVYATTLWRMAQEMRMPEHVVVAPGAMLTRKQISVRIERLLDETPLGRRYISAAALAISVVALTGVAALAATAPPIVLAQNDTPIISHGPVVISQVIVAQPQSPPPAPLPASPVAVMPAMPKTPKTPAPAVLPSEARKAIAQAEATSAAESIDAENLGQKIQADVQRSLSDLTKPRHIAMSDDDNGPVTRDMVRSCIGCDLSRRDLRGLDLSNLSLIGDDISRSDLRGVNLHASKLTGVDLSYSDLRGADLSNASLRGVDLSHSSMRGANTSGIHLIGSSLP
jgi:beta-lactamase regulating signal transducer with metallopeptidase domain